MIWIISILAIILLFLFSTTIKIKVNELTFDIKSKIEKLDIKIYFLLFNKVPWLKFNINNQKLNNSSNDIKSKIINNVFKTRIITNYRKSKLSQLKQIYKILSKFPGKIEKIFIEVAVGSENPIITSGLVVSLSTFLSIIFSKLIKNFSPNKHQYKVIANYNDNNFTLFLNCIISFKLVHIITMKYVKKERKCLYYDRTSNRRTYGNCHE